MIKSALLVYFTLALVNAIPNIIMVLVDDWGFSDLSSDIRNETIFESHAKTPVIKSMINEGRILERHYTASWCAPSRISFQSGRLPLNVVRKEFYDRTGNLNWLAINSTDPNGYNGIPLKMTSVAKKMKAAGYRTHYSGKWGAGFATVQHSPVGQGYDTQFGYLQSGNNYYTETLDPRYIEQPSGCELAYTDFLLTDLCANNVPATDRNNTIWEDYLIMDHTMKTIRNHDSKEPLFLMHAFHSLHTPLNPPEELQHVVDVKNKARRHYLGMLKFVDTSLGKIRNLLQEKEMWENTLLVVSSDNGGPIYPSAKKTKDRYSLFGGASNFPLRGGKVSDFEGGIRTTAFVTGGLVPEEVRGRPMYDYVHISDWYSTFAHLAGVSAFDDVAHKAGLPPVDGVNQWNQIAGASKLPARTEMHISSSTLIQDNWKLIRASSESTATSFNKYGVGWGLSSYFGIHGRDCLTGCLFDILKDPFEKMDKSRKYERVTANLIERLDHLNQHHFKNNVNQTMLDACNFLKDNNQGFYGPFWDPIRGQMAIL